MKVKDLKQGRYYAVRSSWRRGKPRKMKLLDADADYMRDGSLRSDAQRDPKNWAYRQRRVQMREVGFPARRYVLPRDILRPWSEQKKIDNASAAAKAESDKQRTRYKREHRAMVAVLRSAGLRKGKHYAYDHLMVPEYQDSRRLEIDSPHAPAIEADEHPEIALTAAGVAKLAEVLAS